MTVVEAENGERTRLLSSRPPSYVSVDNEEQQPDPEAVPNKISRADLVWVLMGLWSAVFLGALDGKWTIRIPHVEACMVSGHPSVNLEQEPSLQLS